MFEAILRKISKIQSNRHQLTATSVPLLSGSQTEIMNSGTATVIDPEKGIVATAKHNVENCTRFCFKQNGLWTEAKLFATHDKEDLAILEIDPDTLRDTSKLKWVDHARTDKFLKIYGWVRVRERSFNKFRRKIISGSIQIASEQGWVLGHRWFNGDLRGMSGSPAINQRGELVGLFTGVARYGLVITPIDYLAPLLS